MKGKYKLYSEEEAKKASEEAKTADESLKAAQKVAADAKKALAETNTKTRTTPEGRAFLAAYYARGLSEEPKEDR